MALVMHLLLFACTCYPRVHRYSDGIRRTGFLIMQQSLLGDRVQSGGNDTC